MPICYLASPYSWQSKSKEIGANKPDYSQQKEEIEQKRYELITEATARLYETGITVISPITLTHPLAKQYGLGDKGLDFWLEHDFRLILRCDFIIVLMLDGWKDSTGVNEEIKFCHSRGIPVLYGSLENGKVVFGG